MNQFQWINRQAFSQWIQTLEVIEWLEWVQRTYPRWCAAYDVAEELGLCDGLGGMESRTTFSVWWNWSIDKTDATGPFVRSSLYPSVQRNHHA